MEYKYMTLKKTKTWDHRGSEENNNLNTLEIRNLIEYSRTKGKKCTVHRIYIWVHKSVFLRSMGIGILKIIFACARI